MMGKPGKVGWVIVGIPRRWLGLDSSFIVRHISESQPGRQSMAGRWIANFSMMALAASAFAAEPVGVNKPGDLPPLVIPATGDAGQLPQGKSVSRPLQEAERSDTPEIKPVEPPGKLDAELIRTEAEKPLGASWSSYELLVWWPKAQSLPPLVTAGRGPNAPALGGPNTMLLVGGSAIDSINIAGGRFTFGSPVNESQTAGLAITYFFLGSRTASVTIDERSRAIGRPYLDTTGLPAAIPVSLPGGPAGTVTASTSSRATGWEVNGIANLYSGPELRLNAIAGYRYFMINEGLRVDQTAWLPPSPNGPAIMASIADQFDAHNRFHGGQLGLTADLSQGPVFVEATGKVALGQATNVVQVSGQSVALAAGFPIPAVQYFNSGVLAQPTNSGRFVRNSFAVLPEASLKVGYRFQDRSRLYVGYNFIYLSEAVRPGDQVDTTLDPGQVALFPRPGGVAVERPVPTLVRSDFWVQGLMFGVEYRY